MIRVISSPSSSTTGFGNLDLRHEEWAFLERVRFGTGEDAGYSTAHGLRKPTVRIAALICISLEKVRATFAMPHAGYRSGA